MSELKTPNEILKDANSCQSERSSFQGKAKSRMFDFDMSGKT